MRSHGYDLNGRQVVRVMLRPLLGVMLAAACLRLASWSRALPPERAWTDPERTVLVFKREAAASVRPAQVLLMGDSSCMMGVDAPLLGRLLPGQPEVLNLSLIYGLGLRTGAELAAEFARRHEGEVGWVVLLVTPPKLAEAEGDPALIALWESLDVQQGVSRETSEIRWEQWAGVGLFRDRALPYLLAVPLRGRGAAFYGFTSGVWSYLEAHDGSLIDLGEFHRPTGRSIEKWELGSTLERESRAVRAVIPPGVHLAAGLTPVPESLVDRSWTQQRTERLRQWGLFLTADLLLTNLPARLPDGLFASGAHFDAKGQERFTVLLARELAPALEASAEAGPSASEAPPRR